MMDFVTATANLRAHVFSIPMQTRFQIKRNHIQVIRVDYCVEMAGNIIPAIATTNAIVAGLMTLNAQRILATSPSERTLESFPSLYLSYSNKSRLIHASRDPPIPSCTSCGCVYAPVECPSNATVRDLVNACAAIGDMSLLGPKYVLIFLLYLIKKGDFCMTLNTTI